MAEIVGHRHLRVGLFRGVDPQVEQGSRILQLAAGLGVLLQLAFEARESVLRHLQHQLVVLADLALVILIGLRQLLPAFLMLARQAERRQVHPAITVPLQVLQPRAHLLHPPVEAVRAALHAAEDVGERILGRCGIGHAERGAPGAADVAGVMVAAGELGRDLLHLPEPLAGLPLEAAYGLVHLRLPARHQLGPPVDRLLPARICAGHGHRRRRRASLSQGVAP